MFVAEFTLLKISKVPDNAVKVLSLLPLEAMVVFDANHAQSRKTDIVAFCLLCYFSQSIYITSERMNLKFYLCIPKNLIIKE